MCGRFTLRTPLSVLAQQFQFELGANAASIEPRYNIAPSQRILAVRSASAGTERELAPLYWGLVPAWAKDTKSAFACINARADSVATKPTFRTAFKKRRCLVLADGYYEWHTEGKLKQPFLFEVNGGQPFAIAGLWESWRDPAAGDQAPALESCTLITTDANAVGADVHHRMPVILNAADYEMWLDPALSDRQRLEPLLTPFPAERMTARPVSRHVNNARHEGADCIGPP